MGKPKRRVHNIRKRKKQFEENVRRMAEANKARRNSANKQPSLVGSLLDLDATSTTNVEDRNQPEREILHYNIVSNRQQENEEISDPNEKVSILKKSDAIEQLPKDLKDISFEKNRKRKYIEDKNKKSKNAKKLKHSSDQHQDLPFEITSQKEEEIVTIKDGDHRIVNFKYFTEELMRISSHESLFKCSFYTLKLVSETKHGFISKFKYECALCKKEFVIKNSPENLNIRAVQGAMAAGCGNALLGQITASLDLPSLSDYTYGVCQNEICQAWEITAWDEMKKAGDREREAAIMEGRVNKNGIPLIDVIADGCWSKRSYKTNYAALSGAAAIIGRRFGQVLFMSVKNKYCCICARADKRNETSKHHECFKNYSGTSTAMESVILAEGFKQSMVMHQVIYARLIADGDSSTYAKILESRPYSDTTVEKINCRNHILRNFCNKMQQTKSDTKYNLNDRKKVTTGKILSARKYITDSIKYHNENRKLDSVKRLHSDINQSIYHAFDRHGDCNRNICSNKSQECADFFSSGIFHKIRFLASNVASHARSLIENVDSNIVERFNGVIAKFVGGKRINYSLKRSYQGRCAGAVISFNSGKLHTTVSKKIYNKSPAKRLKSYEEKVDKRRKYDRTLKRKKNRNLLPKKIDFNYGENVETPDMDEETYENSKITFLKNLEKTDNERREIQSRTILQSECGEWMELRRNLLTASNFGKVVKRIKTNSCASTVKNMLYKPDIGHVASINHGRTHEKVALEQLTNLLDVKIEPCGLFIDKEYPFLGATPDGIIENNTLVEIKCPIIPYKIGLDDAITQGKMHFWRINKKSGEIEVNKKSDWYMQVQGQMRVCNMAKCLLVVWYGHNKIKIETIIEDSQFWKEKMEPKLIEFYFDCMLPELIDPRFTRNKPIRDPPYVTPKNKNKENVDHCSAKENYQVCSEPNVITQSVQFDQF